MRGACPDRLVSGLTQHFVPLFYLKYFTDAQSNIHAFDIVEQKQFVTSQQLSLERVI